MVLATYIKKKYFHLKLDPQIEKHILKKIIFSFNYFLIANFASSGTHQRLHLKERAYQPAGNALKSRN
jgi:hypothetical protein